MTCLCYVHLQPLGSEVEAVQEPREWEEGVEAQDEPLQRARHRQEGEEVQQVEPVHAPGHDPPRSHLDRAVVVVVVGVDYSAALLGGAVCSDAFAPPSTS